MHICFITSEFPKPGFAHGGVGTFIATLSKALVKKGVMVSVVGKNYTHEDEDTIIEGVHVYRVKSKKIKGLQWYFNVKAVDAKIKRIHEKNPIDFVETTELRLAFIHKIKGVKYVIRMNGGHHYFAKAEHRKTQFKDAFQEKRSFAKADAILAVSDFVKEETRTLVGLGDVKIHVIYNPIDVAKFYDTSTHETEPFSIFFAGSLVEKKGIRQLVQSLEYLVDQYPKLHLYIAGRDALIPGTKLPYRPILEKAITHKIRDHITFLGVVPNDKMPEMIAKSQLCCYPSHMEAMPLAWLEVLAMGKVFVGSKTGPGPEAVKDTVTGLLADPYDPKDIAEKIKWVFENPEKAKQMGALARKDIISRFSIDTIVDQNISFYKNLLQQQ